MKKKIKYKPKTINIDTLMVGLQKYFGWPSPTKWTKRKKGSFISR